MIDVTLGSECNVEKKLLGDEDRRSQQFIIVIQVRVDVAQMVSFFVFLRLVVFYGELMLFDYFVVFFFWIYI